MERSTYSPGPPDQYSVGELRRSLAARIRGAAGARPRIARNLAASSRGEQPPAPTPGGTAGSACDPRTVIAIGASTGGTVAIQEILLELSCRYASHRCHTTHSSRTFARLRQPAPDKLCDLEVREAVDGDVLRRGSSFLVAPGNTPSVAFGAQVVWVRHCRCSRGLRVCYPKALGGRDVRPLLWAPGGWQPRRRVLLDRNGNGRRQGACWLFRRAGAVTIAQDRASCVVYGMPREAKRLDAVGTVAALADATAVLARTIKPRQVWMSRSKAPDSAKRVAALPFGRSIRIPVSLGPLWRPFLYLPGASSSTCAELYRELAFVLCVQPRPLSPGLAGYVFNSSSGVTIEIEGGEAEIRTFLATLRSDPPHLAAITAIEVSDVTVSGGDGFSILESHEEQGGFSLISPDAGTCDACWHDFGDPLNRRFGYPFTNCTHCGPRYTIIQDIPYDPRNDDHGGVTCVMTLRVVRRSNRSGAFTRSRMHAPSAARPSHWFAPRHACWLTVRSQTAIRLRDHPQGERLCFMQAIFWQSGGLGGFLLACDAANDAAVAELRRRKRRSDKPFALMARDLASIRAICDVSPLDEAALLSVRRPIVVLGRAIHASVSAEVAPGNDTLGVMLPYTPLHYLLFSDSPDSPSEFPALVMTSGNLSEEPIVVSNAEALRQLDGVADWFLLHNRDIWTRVDDSVVRVFGGPRARAATFPRLRSADDRPGNRAGRGAGLWRRG